MADKRIVYGIFVAVAVLLGAAPFLAFQLTLSLAGSPESLPAAACGLFIGILLVVVGVVRRQPFPGRLELLAILGLFAPTLAMSVIRCAGHSGIPGTRQPNAGDSSLLYVASPLWLALLIAMETIKGEISRTSAAASILAVGAVCLVYPLNEYSVAEDQVLLFVALIFLAILTVITWAVAAKNLRVKNLAITGGLLLSLQSVSHMLGASSETMSVSPADDWRRAIVPVILQATVMAAGTLLWLWLLLSMRLAAFAFHPLAAWIAATLNVFAFFGVGNGRGYAAVALAMMALVFGLRASVVKEQPIALGLSET